MRRRRHPAAAAAAVAALVQHALGCSKQALGGDWFDSATSAVMAVTQTDCVLSSKYGSVRVHDAFTSESVPVAPEAGLFKDLGLTGAYRRHSGTIEWSNGVTWSRGAGMVETRLSSLDAVLGQLRADIQTLKAENTQLKTDVGTLQTDVTTLKGDQAQLLAENTKLKGDVSTLRTDFEAADTALQAAIDALKPCCNSGPSTPAAAPPPPPPPLVVPSPPPPPPDATPAAAPAGNASSADLTEIWEAVRALNSSQTRDGWCMMEPNMTEVYIPVTRYVYRRQRNGDTCVIGGTVPRPGSAQGGPPMNSRGVMTDVYCAWQDGMRSTGDSPEPMLAYVGDTIVFWRRGSTRYTIYEFDNKRYWDDCDFNRAKLLAGKLDLETMERAGRNFSITFDKAGTYYYASDKQGEGEPMRREYCWDTEMDPAGKKWNTAKLKKGWGKGMKLEVRVLDPTKEVMSTCPLYDPSKYGVSGGVTDAADSASVTKMKGALAAVVRQLIAYEHRTQERVRTEGMSGLTIVRTTGQGTDAYHEPSYATGGVANIHNHANTHHTIGMGEWGGVLNGVQWTTRHNDYSLRQPDNTLTKEQYISDWPPKTIEIVFPEVPPSVTSAGNDENQIKEMRKYFEAWVKSDSSIRQYEQYFKPVLCYTECAWTTAQENVAEPFASERHHIDADTWKELNEKTAYLFNSGQKNSAENLPYLPTAILGYRDDGEDTYEPILAQWFYRISCAHMPHIPLKRFRVKNELHVQLRETPPKTRAQLAETRKALFELNPERDASWKPDNPWPKTKTSWEYLDDLISTIPGLDGPNADLKDDTFGPLCSEYLDSANTLNTGFYNRYYALKQKDAMGRSTQKRSFHDYHFAAQTTHKRVIPFSVCHSLDDDQLKASFDPGDQKRTDQCKAIKDQADCEKTKWESVQVQGTADKARCYWTGRACIYQKCWTQRWSYMMPMEIIYLTPLTLWDPYEIGYCDKKTDPCYAAVTANGANGKDKTPYKGARQDIFFRTPATFFKDAGGQDAADTSGGITFVQPQSGKYKGVTKQTRASGHWIHFPEMEGLGKVRQRYPIFPIHDWGSTTWKEVKALEEIVVGKDSRKELKDIFLETRAGAYGVELELIPAPDSHTHHVSLSAAETQDMTTGKRSSIWKTSTLGDGHTHAINIRYDAAKAAAQQNPWEMITCTMSSDKCPGALSRQNPPACSSDANGIVCCNNGECADGHPGIQVYS